MTSERDRLWLNVSYLGTETVEYIVSDTRSWLREGTEIEVGDEYFTVGRHAGCSLYIMVDKTQGISREHAAIFRRQGQYYVRDLNSSNGTIVGEKKLAKGESHELKTGTVIQLGDVVAFSVIDPDETQHAMVVPRQGIWIDLERGDIYVRGQPISLTRQQFRLLEVFVAAPKQVLSRDDLIEKVWFADMQDDEASAAAKEGVSNYSVDNAISRLRERLAAADPDYKYIETVHGIGYKFIPFSPEDPSV